MKRVSPKVLSGAFLVVLCVGLGGCPGRSGEEMPEVVGNPEAEARETLEELGLTVEVRKERRGAAAGTVVDQSPHAGDALPNDNKVTIVVEDAAATGSAEVPSVVGKLAHEAEALLVQAGFRRGQLISQVSSQPKDTVLEQNPAAGSSAAAGSLVDLTVANDTMATVPDVVGQDELSATRLLVDARLRVGNVRRALEGAGSAGLVIEQNPRKEVMVAVNTPVELVIKEDGVVVPAVKDKILDDVATTLVRSGLVYKFVYRIDPGRPLGTITEVSPAGGQRVPRNSEVTLTLARPKGPFGKWGQLERERHELLESIEMKMKTRIGGPSQ